jgi:hypothetical protein
MKTPKKPATQADATRAELVAALDRVTRALETTTAAIDDLECLLGDLSRQLAREAIQERRRPSYIVPPPQLRDGEGR